MVIKRLGIKGFGRLKECELRLSDGINVIYGENETGKTTIQWFIKGMLYGLEGGRTREEGAKPPVKRFKPWEGSQYGGFLEYVLDDGSLYTVNRDFNRNTVRILDSSFNDITHSFEIGKDKRVKFAEEHLGLDEVCFEKTIFTKQMETRIDSGGKQEIVNRLINAQETGYEDVSFKTAEKALADALKTCVGTDKSTTRPLDRTIERLGRLYEMLEELKSRREKFYEIEACIKKTKMMLIKNKKEIDILNIKGELIKTARELCRLRKTKESNRIISESISRLKNIKRYLGAGIIASCFAAAALAVFERAIGNIIEKLVFAGGLRLPEAAHIFPMLTLALIIPGILLLARRRVNKNQRELEKKIINIDGRMERGKTDIDNARGKLFLLVKRLEEEGELKYSPLDFPPPAKEGGDACGPVERGAGDADSILNEEILNEEILNEDILNEEEKGWMIACERARNEEMSLALKLKEYETVMSSMDYDDDKIIQAAVEEIEELEMKKKKLEGIGYSLNKGPWKFYKNQDLKCKGTSCPC